MAKKSMGQIYLYGEVHCDEKIMERQLEIWHEHYHNEGLRYLFLEHCFCVVEFLNIWMRANSNEILEMLYEVALAPDFPYIKDWFKTIKNNCPETVFSGTTPVCSPIGKKYLQYLHDNNQMDSDKYFMTQNLLEKGMKLYSEYGGKWDDGYREENIVNNFIREFEELDGKSVMVIYGIAHLIVNPVEHFGGVPCLGYQLIEQYGEAVQINDLTVVSYPNPKIRPQ